jgi:hypothetical protein
MLSKSTSPFYGIIPGNAVVPLRSVVFPVTFGTRESYHIEYIKFVVSNFETSYHTILDRPTPTKFMVIPHHVYLVLKMPRPNSVLALQGDMKRSYIATQKPWSTH